MPERTQLHKLIDPAPLIAARESHELLEAGGDRPSNRHLGTERRRKRRPDRVMAE